MDDGFYELFGRSSLTAEGVIRGLEKFTDATVIAEELIPGPAGPRSIPFDYKLYTFGESVQFILQIDRNHDLPMLNFFDGSFGALADGLVLSTWKICQPGTAVVPGNASELLEAAQRVSHKLKQPFVSVDLYTDDSHVWLGKATPAPGGPYYGGLFFFSREFDLALGEHRSRGCERLGREVPTLRTEPPRRAEPKSTAAD